MRNRENALPVLVEQDLVGTVRIGDREMVAANVTYHADAVERMRQGDKCAYGPCGEEFEEPWPEKCPVCLMPSRGMFEAEFGGTKWVGPDKSLDELIDEGAEERARKVFQRSGIWVPR